MLRYGPGVALLVVDLQNDFADLSGALAVAGAEAVVPVVAREVAVARANGALVAWTQDWHPERTPHFVTDGGAWPVHCVRETWGAALHPGVEPAPGDPVIRKGANGEDGYSAFTMRDPGTGATVPTELAAILREAAVGELVVAGLATDWCVAATVRDALALGLPTTVLLDAVAAVDLEPGAGERALDELAAAGARLASTRER